MTYARLTLWYAVLTMHFLQNTIGSHIIVAIEVGKKDLEKGKKMKTFPFQHQGGRGSL